MDINSFDFTDCLVLDFHSDERMKTLRIECEAWQPLNAGAVLREKSPVEIHLKDCLWAQVECRPEFWADLERPFNGGDTLKANEINSIRASGTTTTTVDFELISDMLKLHVLCGGLDVFPAVAAGEMVARLAQG